MADLRDEAVVWEHFDMIRTVVRFTHRQVKGHVPELTTDSGSDAAWCTICHEELFIEVRRGG